MLLFCNNKQSLFNIIVHGFIFRSMPRMLSTSLEELQSGSLQMVQKPESFCINKYDSSASCAQLTHIINKTLLVWMSLLNSDLFIAN